MNMSESSSKKLVEVWFLLEKGKEEEDQAAELKFVQDFRVHPNFSTVLALERQLEKLVTFCTNPKEFSIFSIDPTFNIFTENISLTVITYRILKLELVSHLVLWNHYCCIKKRLEKIFQIFELLNY